MVAQCFFVGASIGKYRKKYFTPEFFAKNFPQIKDPPKFGYPDMGSGVFAHKLPYAQWVTFNNAQRAHYNYLEGLTLAVVLELVAGIFFPKYAVWAGISYIIGRYLYAALYIAKGAGARVYGTVFLDASLVAWLVMAVYGCTQLGGGVVGLRALFSF